MTTESDKKPDIICEFCRSQGAPTAYWLAGLSEDGRRECIRQWIIKLKSTDISSQTNALVEKLYEEYANESPFFYDALSAEDLEERFEATRRRARRRVEEQIRYGAICIDEIDSPLPWVEYGHYRELCDEEWQAMVDGRWSKTKRPYLLIAGLLCASLTLATGALYVAAWCGVIVGLIAVFRSWPQPRSKATTGKQMEQSLRSMSKK